MKDTGRTLTQWVIALTVAAVLLLVALAVTLALESSPSWHGHFFKLNPDASPQMRQVFVASDGIVDRCLTCHLPEDVLASNYAHRQHPYFAYGCTSCHGGDGRSLDHEQAHGVTGALRPALNDMLWRARSSCTVCHRQEYVQASSSGPGYGRTLVRRLGCAECHSIPRLYRHTERIDLIKLVQKLRAEYLIALLTQEKPLVTVTRTMPYYGFSEEAANDLGAYLDSLEEFRTPPPYGLLRPGDATEGQNEFDRLGCDRCHVTPQFPEGGDEGPILTGAGFRYRRSWLNWWFSDPREILPFSRMPVYSLGEEQKRILVAYLTTSTGGSSDPYAGMKAGGDPVAGRKLFDDNYCLACHTTDGSSLERKIGPSLAGFASRPVLDLPFKDMPRRDGVEAHETLLDYLSHVRSFEEIVEREVAMPNFMLASDESEPIVAFLMSLRDFEPSRALDSGEPYRKAESRGRILFFHKQCYQCHSVAPVPAGLTRKEGKEKFPRLQGPNLALTGDKVRTGWLEHWLSAPYEVLNHSDMPDPMLQPHETADLAAYLSTLKGKLPVALTEDIPQGREALREGEQLFQKNFCVRCHKVYGRGIAAYTGPDLSNIGVKVTPEFMVSWLKRAGDIQPDTDMDDFGLSQQEALKIYLFLRTLRTPPSQAEQKE
ncbi:MAG: c-type cytochrome [Planctomycetota bacterium]|nr:c-type cytochrome [Planctomycetota bacterium]